MVDTTRPWGQRCQSCAENVCSGHFISDIEKLLKLQGEGKAIRALPPSKIIGEFFDSSCSSERHQDPTQDDLRKLAKKCCLTVEEVEWWLEHLTKTRDNRRRGAEKAKLTRARKNKAQHQAADA